MTGWLMKRYIKDDKDLQDPKVRTACGELSSWVGIICNIFLCAGKFLAGILSGSVSITADAMNNLSDMSSSVISLLGFKMASRPADAEHPYGHARYEYLSGLIVAVMIMVIGVELLKTSLDKALHPEPVEFGWLTAGVLILSILVKLWMARFNSAMGKKIQSKTLEATAADSRNDVITTGAVLLAAVISAFTSLQLDGIMGLIVAGFILFGGVQIVKDTLNPLLGQAPNPLLVEEVRKKIMRYPGVLGTHDLMVHDYGPGRQFASVHVEMAAENDVMMSHDVIDNIERDFLREDNLHLVIHLDPIITGDDKANDMRSWLAEQVLEIDPRLTIHDLRMVPGVTHTNVIFDCVKPFELELSDNELIEQIQQRVDKKYDNYYCVITVESGYAAMPHYE